jgi:protein SMG7
LQLAVLATYVSDELLAVYRYFRSLAVETPFLTARDNLILLFEKVIVCSVVHIILIVPV